MNRDHLGLDILAVIQRMDEGSGFRVNDRKAGDLIKVITAKQVFTLIVVNPEAQEVIILGEEEMFREPKIFILEGANWGGSMIKVGYVLTGCFVKFRSLTEGGFGLLPIIEDFAEFEGEMSEQTKAIIEKAEASRPRHATSEEVAVTKKKFWEWVDGYAWGEHKDAVTEMIKRFCFLNGQAYISGIFVQALEAGKVQAALELLEKQYYEHWSYRPEDLRGEIITQSDDHYLRLAYAELGLVPIGRAG